MQTANEEMGEADEESRNRISRRNFLKLLGCGAMVFAFGASGDFGRLLRNNSLVNEVFAQRSTYNNKIMGYSDVPSVTAGSTLTLHISTDSPNFEVDFHRQGATLKHKLTDSSNII